MATKRITLKLGTWFELDPKNSTVIQVNHNGGLGVVIITESPKKPTQANNSFPIIESLYRGDNAVISNWNPVEKVYLLSELTDTDVTISANADYSISEAK